LRNNREELEPDSEFLYFGLPDVISGGTILENDDHPD